MNIWKTISKLLLFWAVLVLNLWSQGTCCFMNSQESNGLRKTDLQLASCFHACLFLSDYKPHTSIVFPSFIQLFTECPRVPGTACGTELMIQFCVEMFPSSSAMSVLTLCTACLSRSKKKKKKKKQNYFFVEVNIIPYVCEYQDKA